VQVKVTVNHSNKKKKSRRGGSCKVRCKDGCKKSAVKTALEVLTSGVTTVEGPYQYQ
jgi:hypothetical protein